MVTRNLSIRSQEFAVQIFHFSFGNDEMRRVTSIKDPLGFCFDFSFFR